MNNNTDEQEQIINSDAEHLLVVAGAGSGKTTTLINRIHRLLAEKGIRPQSILGLTFTVKASLELAERSAKDSSSQDGAIRVQTYDAFIQGIVRQYGLLIGVDPQMAPLSDAGIRQCIANVMEENSDSINKYFDEIAAENPDYTLPSMTPYANSYSADLQTEIKKFTDGALNFLVDEKHLSFDDAVKSTECWNDLWIASLERLLKDSENKDQQVVSNLKTLLCTAKLRKLVVDLSKRYSAMKEEQNLAEYGDFTLYALKLVCTFPSISQAYREKYRYVCLDEYQDTNHPQGILIKLLFGEGSVIAVGDRQQAIYGFRGSTPEAFPLFEKGFGISEAEGNKLRLSKTFRNKENVANLANCITELHLPKSERQDLTADPGEGEICALSFKGALGGARAVWKFVEDERKKGSKKIAVLGRKNKNLQAYKDFLEEKGIACALTGNTTFDSENPIARDLRNFLSVCSDPFAATQAEDLLTSPRYGLPLDVLRRLACAVSGKNKELNQSLNGEDDAPEEKDAGKKARRLPLLTLPLYLLGTYRLPASEGVLEKFRKGLQSVAKVIPQGIEGTVIAAWKALDFNADMGVAEALLGKLPYAKLTLEDVLEAVKVYEGDLPSGQNASLQGFLGWIEDYEKTARQSASGGGMVEIMTIHQAKGLEWDGVAVVGMEKNPEKQILDFSDDGFENQRGRDRNGKLKRAADSYWKNTWINSCSAIPGNLRSDLGDCDPYRKACEKFDNAENYATLEDLSKCIDDLCKQEIRRDEVEEVHTAYVAMTRSKGDLLLVSEAPYTFDVNHLQNTAYSGEFWVDAVNFILNGECCSGSADAPGWKEGMHASEEEGKASFAIYSTGGKELEEAIKSELKKPLDQAEGEYAWPLQIKEGLREMLVQSADRVLNASQDRQGNLSRQAEEVIKFHSLPQTKKSLEEQFREAEKDRKLSATFLQWLEKNPRIAMQSVIRPMPHGSEQKAEAGTEFHAWVQAHLLNPSEEWQCKIKSEYEEEISRWKGVFLASEWSGREPFCAEESFTVLLPGLLAPVTAKMDAVFKGDLKGGSLDSKLTIVDWKTGEVPKTDKKKDEKLLQLEIYRLVLARALKKDISDIDACLYYLSEGGCQIPALPMDEEEIIRKITSIEGMSALSNEAQEGA